MSFYDQYISETDAIEALYIPGGDVTVHCANQDRIFLMNTLDAEDRMRNVIQIKSVNNLFTYAWLSMECNAPEAKYLRVVKQKPFKGGDYSKLSKKEKAFRDALFEDMAYIHRSSSFRSPLSAIRHIKKISDIRNFSIRGF